MNARTVIRRTAVGVAAVAVLAGTFSLGVVAGTGSTPAPVMGSPSGVLDGAADQIVGSALNPVDRAALDRAAMNAMLGAAGDQWGSWASGKDGSTGGVGLWLRRAGGRLLVTQVAAGSPAQLAGVRMGDQVLAVDGQPTSQLRAEVVTARLKGRPGSTVTLALKRDGVRRLLTLKRVLADHRSIATDLLPDQVGLIVVPTFHQGAGREVRNAVRDLRRRDAAGLILDLRGNPGGLLSEAVETASAFLDGGHIVTYARRDEPPQRLNAEGTGDTSTPLVVLVDGSTASAAEVVAGALQDRDRAVIVGARTFGKGSVQEPRVLPDGSSLALTVARYSLPSGRSVEGVGVEPDIVVSSTAVSGSDPAVSRGREVLIGLRANVDGGG